MSKYKKVFENYNEILKPFISGDVITPPPLFKSENFWVAELAINENDAPWEDFFVADKKGRKWHGWRIHHALTIDGQTIEVIIPHGDISKLKFVLRGG